MPLPLALPLAPVVSSGASAASVTFVAGSTFKLIDSIYGFRRPTPTLPPITGLEGVATLRELIGDALAGARIPVAMPPSPLGPNGSLAAIAAAAAAAGIWNGLQSGIAQLFGLVNGPQRSPPEVQYPFGLNPNDPFQGVTGWKTPKPGQTLLIYKIINGQADSLFTRAVSISALSIGGAVPSDPTRRFNNYNFVTIDGANVFCGSPPCADDPGVVGYRVETSDGLAGAQAIPTFVNPTTPGTVTSWISLFPWPQIDVDRQSLPNPVALPGLPAYLPSTAPTVQPTPGTQPQVAPVVVPVQPGPSRPAVPAIVPARPPTIAPWLFPGAIPASQQTTPAGAVAPLPLPLPQPTPAGNIFPVAGAPPLTAAGPRATIQAIATEVGRIEQKVDRMLNPAPPSNGLDRLGELMAVIGGVAEALLAAQSGGTYTMAGPCEVDSSGEPIVDIREVQFPGALTVLGVMVNRLDALAVLLQEHKNLRQPTCRKKTPVGEFVTVNFEQI